MWRLALTLSATACTVYGYTWTNAKFGGGGYITGFEFSPTVNGLIYARTDVGGAYRRDPWSKNWIPLQDSVGRNDVEQMGVLSMALDPNDDKIIYLMTGMYLDEWGHKGTLMRSTDRGRTWTKIPLPFKVGGNSDGRGTGERLQVDPNLSSTLYMGTNNDGLWRSTDFGATWNRVWDFYKSSTTFVTIDKSTGSRGSASKVIYVGVAVTDGSATVFRSADGGNKWGPVGNQPLGLMAFQGKLDGKGNLYVTYGDVQGPNGVTKGAVYKFRIKDWAWDNITPPQTVRCGFGGVGISRENPSIIVVSTLDRWALGDEVYRSMNGGQSWVALNEKSRHVVDDVGYLQGEAQHMGHWLTDVEIDPYNDGHFIYNTGYGLWETWNGLTNDIKWEFAIDGIEESCPLMIRSPSSGPAHLMVGHGDYNGVLYKTNFADNSGYFPVYGSGISVDYASYWGSFMARTTLAPKKGYLSWNGGDNWYPMTSHPVSSSALSTGDIAVAADGQTLVWVPVGLSAFYSHDNGVNWKQASGYTTDPTDASKYFHPIADRNHGSYFYAYDFNKGVILESSDKGVSWHVLFNNLDTLPTYMSAHELMSVPIQRRELWLGTSNGLWRISGPSASGPVKIQSVQSAWAVSWGASKDGRSYPALYISGKVNNVVGIFQSLDAGQSWNRINDDQHQFNVVNQIAGDPREFGVVYIGSHGRGVQKGTP